MTVWVIFGMIVGFAVTFRYFFNVYREQAEREVRDVL